MKILYAAAEALPYFKTGGLADVSRALPDALRARGHDVRIVHPYYRSVPLGSERVAESALAVPWRGGTVECSILFDEPGEDRAPAALVRQPALFEATMPYVDPPGDPFAQAVRFAFFARAVVAYARAWGADVVHANDWHTGLVPLYGLVDGLDAATVFAIHNLAYQGNYAPAVLAYLDVPGDLFRTENGVEFYGRASFMKAGIVFADRLVTVSPTYAREIQTPAHGAGFDGLLRFRRRVLHGILNGIDRELWNPARDAFLPAPFHVRALAGKETCRQAALAELGLSPGGPLFVAISRLVHQKGIDVLLHALPELLALGARVAVLGDGDPAVEAGLARAAAYHEGQVALIARFDDPLAHRLYGAADFLIMPSRYEPCGLGQMIAQRYGTVPIATRTGGLADTIEDGRTGFLFDAAEPAALLDAARRALALWQGPDWNTLRRRCMRLEWSWDRSAIAYERVYGLAAAAL